MKVKQEQHHSTLDIDVRLFERMLVVFAVIYHRTDEALLNLQALVGELFKRGAFQLYACFFEVRCRIAVGLVAEEIALNQLSETPLAGIVLIQLPTEGLFESPSEQSLAVLPD